MPELAPVTRHFWPWRIPRILTAGITTGGCPSSPVVGILGTPGLGSAEREEVRDQPGPAGLVRGADAAAGVAVEVLEEEQVVPEVRVVLQLRVAAEHRPPPVGPAQEEAGQPVRPLLPDPPPAPPAPPARRALHPG